MLESLFSKVETPTQMFSFEICETFKNTFLQGTPPVAACYINVRISSLLIL